MKFELVPFPSQPLPQVSLSGEAGRQENLLSIRYDLRGDLETVLIPSASKMPERRDDLWKSTCFEFFLAIPGQPGYWEFNMSPTGDWNVYRMDGYRRVGFREEASIHQLAFSLEKRTGMLDLKATINLHPLFSSDETLELGITAVLQRKDGKETFWALSHPAPQADFHLRESFILLLAGQTVRSGQSARND